MTYTSLYGQVLGRADVSNAVVTTLHAWIVPMLAQVERQQGLPARSLPTPGGGVWPPLNANAIRGGLDFTKWQGDQLPTIIVLCQPTGDAEKIAMSVYQQWYEVQIGCLIGAADEAAAITLADRYGEAVELIVAQQGGMGTRVDSDGTTVISFAERTEMISAPKTEFIEGEPRNLTRSVTVAHVLVGPVVDGSQGLRTPPTDPYADPGQWPTVTSIKIGLQSKDPLGRVSPGSGVTVTDSTGHVVVSE